MPAAGGLMRGQGLTRAEREARPRSLRMGLNPGPSARSQPASNHRGRAAIRGDWIFHYGCIESRHPPVQVVPNRLQIGSGRSQSAPAQHKSSPGGYSPMLPGGFYGSRESTHLWPAQQGRSSFLYHGTTGRPPGYYCRSKLFRRIGS